ncbi:MAG: hypothetical protein ACJAU1_000979 [Psychromonas sp.]|jgi:hypothetical protein
MIEPTLLKVILPAHMTILSALDQRDQLKNQLDSAFILIIKRCEARADKCRYRSLSLQAVLIILSVSTTIFIGLKFNALELLWANMILIACAIVTGLWVFETYKSYHCAWLKFLALQNTIKRLRLEYKLVLGAVNFLAKGSLAGAHVLIAEQVHIKYWNKLQSLLYSINPTGLKG